MKVCMEGCIYIIKSLKLSTDFLFHRPLVKHYFNLYLRLGRISFSMPAIGASSSKCSTIAAR